MELLNYEFANFNPLENTVTYMGSGVDAKEITIKDVSLSDIYEAIGFKVEGDTLVFDEDQGQDSFSVSMEGHTLEEAYVAQFAQLKIAA